MALLRTSTKSELIRSAAKILGTHQSNKVIQEYIYKTTSEYDDNGRTIKKGIKCSVVQIHQILGRYEDRKLNTHHELYRITKRFLSSCNNDFKLARRLIRDFEVTL